MRSGLIFAAAPIGALILGFSLVAACGTGSRRSGFETQAEPTEDPDASVATGPTFTEGPSECAGLQCKRLACEGKSKTTLTGVVYDPAGANGLYNVMVFIPGGPQGDAPLPEITSGASCERCSSVALNPMMITLTNTRGEFVLEDVPVDRDVPIVIQVGKWRRKLKIDITKECAENRVPDREFRLPRNGAEGDMPQIAVTTGACDALECLLRGIGIDESEFVPGHDPNGHVHVFNGEGGEGVPGSPPAGGTASDPFGGELWNDVQKMAPYDMVLMSCECDEANDNKGGAPGRPGARQAMWDYANLGGRIFATHFHYTWFKNSPQQDWQKIADWNGGSGSDGVYNIDTSFPKGEAFAEWLLATHASSTLGKIQLTEIRDSFSRVFPPAQSWIMEDPSQVRYFTFNTPTSAAPEEQCGRAVMSDLHVTGMSAGGAAFPNGCPAPGGLSAQQKALEFLFFDLSGCVQSDDVPPEIPK